MDALLTSFGWLPTIAVFVVIYLFSCLKVVNEYERLVVFTLGKVEDRPKGPGLCFVWRPFQTSVTVSLRTVVMDVPSQDIITRDNVSLKVSAVVYFKVLDPKGAIIGVENYYYATSQMAQTTLRSILGEVTLEKRAKISAAEGELMASQQLLEAANKISQNPTAIQMRYLQTLAEIATEKNSTIIFPLPMELMKAFEKFTKE